jgi:hypothetical protein
VLSHQPSTAPTGEGNVVANTPLLPRGHRRLTLGISQLDWLQAVARSHTKFVTDLASMYANAIRNGLSG